MKKLLFFITLLGLGLGSANAQKNWTFGLNGGVHVGDAEEAYSFHASGDVAYRIDIINLLDIGGIVGYTHYFGDNYEVENLRFQAEDLQFISLAGTARLRLLSLLFVGTDLGYAIGIGDDSDGGFYVRPQIGVNLGIVNVLASYSNISNDGTNIASINGGVEVKF